MSLTKVDRKSSVILEALKSAPVYRKQATVRARRGKKDEKITTIVKGNVIETESVANEGDWIITNPTGEEYIVSSEQFQARYEATKVQCVYQAKGYCRAIENPFGFPIEILASWGESQFGDEHCMIANACDQNGNQVEMEPYLIEANAFSKTYILHDAE